MESPRDTAAVLDLVERAVGDLQDLPQHLAGRREKLLRKWRYGDVHLRYRWSWWTYPLPRTPGTRPRRVAGSRGWYESQIDALAAACKDPCLKRSREVFHVCILWSSSPAPEMVERLLYHCMAPWKKDGSLPLVGSPMHPSHHGELEAFKDAVYKAHAEYASFDKCDCPCGVEFIAIAPVGLRTILYPKENEASCGGRKYRRAPLGGSHDGV